LICASKRDEPCPAQGNRTLFEPEAQPDLFGAQAAPAYRPDPDEVRARLHRMLAEERAARTLPWDPGRTSLYRTIFPQMTLLLPEEEGAQLRFEFEAEMARFQSA
jgi:hypothetical protein